jgi:transposase
VDDFALRRGRTYGTILVDLEHHRVVDLLPDRTAAVFAAWLASHPGVEVISRDRGGAYADGARRGAPAAQQVADRFHLLANAGEALERVLARRHADLRAAAAAVDRARPPTPPAGGAPAPDAGTTARPTTRAAKERAARRERRLARYEAVVALAAEGWSQVAIAARLGIDRRTVRRFVRAGAFPERVPAGRRASILAPYEAHLRARWAAGCRNARLLFEEIAARGFPGAASLVRAHVGRWRTGPARRGRAAARAVPDGGPAPGRATEAPSPRRARWLLLRPAAGLDGDQQAFRAALLAASDEVRTAHALTEAFVRLVRDRDHAGLAPWLDRAAASGPPEIRGFAAHVRRDRGAIDAALRHPWSNGQTEGHVNRLKAIKRAMYGRAHLDLLRRRVLDPTA